MHSGGQQITEPQAAPAASAAAPVTPAPAKGPEGWRIRTRADASGAVALLDAMARRGKLAGFEAGGGDGVFRVRDFGHPFESELVARAERVDGWTEFTLRRRLRPAMPWVFGLMLVATIWPGVWLTDSMLATYFGWYRGIETWWWYLPLTVPAAPWAMWSAIRKSCAAGDNEAAIVVGKIEAALGSSGERTREPEPGQATPR
ncbi:MAG: hypothetical protein KF745_01315 [Phycisphaeraceae bacterium]|nr:hypothetical protein [Phycisphaeraceae bacterium]